MEQSWLSKSVSIVSSVPKKIFYGVLLGAVMVIIVLKFLVAKTATDAKELNLGSLIKDAVDKFQINTNSSKIKELEKPVDPKTVTDDPNKVVDFYKNRK